ncbi:RlmE/FtsJ family methyltransferase [Candidatus Nardonella dryophthoridicola]|uniref:RlmE/FtsJ family methyltransferase n=1 Tax=Candidatus Nardonella dryophthoridicola TaxID=1971485 RepID=UPI001AD87CD7|nr:FtsJ-like methyltransferase family protein [Candidatus Nardonella dryophthoridicola]QTJ62945.1 SAM-dependent methyltransferase [Candidatus Nardonella dryophthoridicola]
MKIKNNKNNYFYFKESKRLKLISKSWFKIYEIDKKFNIFKNNTNIIDLGSYPGGWIKYIIDNFKNIKIFSCDIKNIEIKNKNIFFIKGDIYKTYNLLINIINNKNICRVDTIISDICHKITGHNDIDIIKIIDFINLSLKLCNDILKNKGNLVFKCFNGSKDIKLIINKIKKMFNIIKIIKPISSNKNSKEFYIVCKNFKRNKEVI